jgi:hypothetical protein
MGVKVKMTQPELTPEQVRKRKRSLLWNFMTVLTLLCMAGLVYYFVTLYRNPGSPFNLFPPIPTATVYYTPSNTITPLQQPSTWTPTATIQPSSTRTKASTWTLLPELMSATPSLAATETLTPSLTTTAMPAQAEITYFPSTELYPTRNCDWFGVGGTVLDTEGNPLQFQTIQMGGSFGTTTLSQPILRLSGSAPNYGVSGFEFELGSEPVESTQTLWIQLFDNSGRALTNKLFFDTYADCTRNLVKITFNRIR